MINLEPIKELQRIRWAEINRKEAWTMEDFEEAIHCNTMPVLENGIIEPGFISMEILQLLAFDVRTPLDKAEKLQGLLKAYRDQLTK